MKFGVKELSPFYRTRCETYFGRAGFTPTGAPVQKKNVHWGPYYMNTPHRLPSANTHSSHHRHFVEDPC